MSNFKEILGLQNENWVSNFVVSLKKNKYS